MIRGPVSIGVVEPHYWTVFGCHLEDSSVKQIAAPLANHNKASFIDNSCYVDFFLVF